jgi:hypothetical protein
LPGFGAALDVVCRDGLDAPGLPDFGFSVGDGFGCSDGLDHGGRRENFGSGLADFLDRIGIHVIAVDVGDQNEVGFGEAGEFRGLGGIEVDGLSTGFDQRAGVIQRRDFNWAGGGGKVWVSVAACASSGRARKSR